MPFVDNTPLQALLLRVNGLVRRLGFAGCEVLEVRLDAHHAVIKVDRGGDLEPEFQEAGFAGLDEGPIRVLWRINDNHHDTQGAGHDRVRGQAAEALGAGAVGESR